MRAAKSISLSIGTAMLAACTSVPDLDTRREAALTSTLNALTEIMIPTRSFDLAAFLPASFDRPGKKQILTVYIEGDGLAWITRTRPSHDPTPATPLVTRLMDADPRAPTAYLARPCQYVGPQSRGCATAFWTNMRFAPQVVAAMDEAVTVLKSKAGATKLRLVGYSGGGVVAALVAARRPDVAELITIAAPMDVSAFTAHHGVSDLTGSLNPVADATALAAIPQVHFVGAQDSVVPPSIVESYLRALPSSSCARLHVFPSASHIKGWMAQTRTLQTAVDPCTPGAA